MLSNKNKDEDNKRKVEEFEKKDLTSPFVTAALLVLFFLMSFSLASFFYDGIDIIIVFAVLLLITFFISVSVNMRSIYHNVSHEIDVLHEEIAELKEMIKESKNSEKDNSEE